MFDVEIRTKKALKALSIINDFKSSIETEKITDTDFRFGYKLYLDLYNLKIEFI